MKTKVLVNTLTSLRVIPHFHSDFDGDVLPEAILFKNIVEEMFSSVEILAELSNQLQVSPCNSKEKPHWFCFY